MTEQELADKYLIFKCISGSHAYGMATEHSDMDTRGVFVAPPDYVIGCFKHVEQVQRSDIDETIFEIGKFVKLAVECNPNIIELLFTDDNNVQFIDPAFQILRDNRDLFLSTKAKFTFSGYAVSQLKRIKGHKKWIMQPQPKEAPALTRYCTFIDNVGHKKKLSATKIAYLQEHCILLKGFGENVFRVFDAYEVPEYNKGVVSEDGTNFIYADIEEDKLLRSGFYEKCHFKGTLVCDLTKFKEARHNWKSYWEWKRKRNKDRAALEEKYGFDGKHASHLVRLMRMAEEILTEGKVIVHRPDAQELLDIRNGKMDYDSLIKWAAEQDKKLDDIYKEESNLPKYPNVEVVNKLVMKIRQEFWKRHDLI